MRTAFAVTAEIAYRAIKPLSGTSGASNARPIESPAASSAVSKLPNFGPYTKAYAVTSRIAGRLNASTVPKQELISLLRERQVLLDKKLVGKITSKEKNRLEYVRWSLDRIEDAQHGQALDSLENSVIKYEQFLAEVQALQEQLRRQIKGHK